MFQSSTLFVFYHELGHLIQFSGVLEKKINLSKRETNSNIIHFNFDDHLDEYDSDLFGTNSVINHILDYFDDFSEREKNTKNYECLLSLGLSSIIINFLLLLGNEENEVTKVYYKESDHPHIYVRIFYIFKHFMDNSKNDKYNVNDMQILKTSFLIVSQFYQINNFFDKLLSNFNDIETYCCDLFDGSEKLMYLAKHKQY